MKIFLGPVAGHPDAIVARSRVRLRSFQDEFQISEEESIRHLTFLVEEFFGLLITIHGERFIPGMGDVGVEEMPALCNIFSKMPFLLQI